MHGDVEHWARARGSFLELRAGNRRPHLCYSIAIRREQVFVGASLVDSIGRPQTLLRAPDTEAGWLFVFRFVSALEKHGVRSLTRPILVQRNG